MIMDHLPKRTGSSAAIDCSRCRAGWDRYREILAHPIGDDGEARRSRLIGLQRHRDERAVLRDVHDAEDARVGDGGAEAE